MTETDQLAGKRVLLVDDQQMFLDALRRIVEDAGMTVHGVATSMAEVERALRGPAPDVVLLDYRLPDGDTLAALPTMTSAWPDTAVVVITGYSSTYTVDSALAAGAVAVVPKTRAAAEILVAMRRGLDASSPRAVTRPRVAGERASLTPRELEVLGLIAEGATVNDIARRLSIAPTTTRNHTQSILRKLDASSQLDAVIKASRLGLVNIVG